MSLPAAAEIRGVAEPVKPAARKRASATPRGRVAGAKPDPTPRQSAEAKPRKHLRALAAFGVVLAVSVAASLLLLRNGDDQPAPAASAAVGVSPVELAKRADELGAPVYWAGTLPSRTLELTASRTGSFVRYLPAGVPVGGEDRTLTIATYPMPDAYVTAAGRAKADGMTSSRTKNGGLAVWSTKQPTSVYVAWPGVPSLIEVYAPDAADAHATALSASLRPAR
jgi:hypothetical protein